MGIMMPSMPTRLNVLVPSIAVHNPSAGTKHQSRLQVLLWSDSVYRRVSAESAQYASWIYASFRRKLLVSLTPTSNHLSVADCWRGGRSVASRFG